MQTTVKFAISLGTSLVLSCFMPGAVQADPLLQDITVRVTSDCTQGGFLVFLNSVTKAGGTKGCQICFPAVNCGFPEFFFNPAPFAPCENVTFNQNLTPGDSCISGVDGPLPQAFKTVLCVPCGSLRDFVNFDVQCSDTGKAVTGCFVLPANGLPSGNQVFTLTTGEDGFSGGFSFTIDTAPELDPNASGLLVAGLVLGGLELVSSRRRKPSA